VGRSGSVGGGEVGGPLGDEVSVERFLDEKWVDENTARFVERVTRRSLRNDPLRRRGSLRFGALRFGALRLGPCGLLRRGRRGNA